MTDTRTMSKLLQAPTKGYRDAIVLPPILAKNFKLKVGLFQLVTSSQFHGFERDNPYAHIRWFNKITSALKHQNVSNKDCFKDLLRKCPHHCFSKLHQIDTFYNALTQSDEDSLNAAAGGNLLNHTPRDALTIIKNKSKVNISQNKPIVSKVNTTSSSPYPSSDVIALTEIVKELVLMNKATQQATVKAIEETCVTCGRPHPYYECLTTSGNTFDACATVGTYNQGGPSIPPTSSFLSNEVKREQKVTKDKVQSISSESTTHVQPPVVQVPILEPDVALKPNPKPSIPYPSRLNDQQLIADPVGVAKDVFMKVGKFYFPVDFVVVDYDVDPRVPFILERPFLRTTQALIDVYSEEITLRVNDEAITFKVKHTSRYSRNYYKESINQINVLNVACEVYDQEVLGFLNSSTSGNLTPSDPIIASSFPSFTLFEGGDFFLDEIETFLVPRMGFLI
nr:reverse transcriptase domain-containing protein [Tanacetum cinerariifolium]